MTYQGIRFPDKAIPGSKVGMRVGADKNSNFTGEKSLDESPAQSTKRCWSNPDKPEISALTVVCNILGALFFFGILEVFAYPKSSLICFL